MAPPKKKDAPAVVRRAFDPNFDPSRIVTRVVENKDDQSIFQEVDERGIQRAPNIIEWLIGKQFSAVPKLFSKQIEIFLNLLGQFCPLCTEDRFLVQKPDRVELVLPTEMPHVEVLQHIRILEHGGCQKCGSGRNDLIEKRLLMQHNELVGCAGMRGGKSVMSAMIGSYQLHRYLTVPDPARYFDLLPKQLLLFWFVALTAEQARRNLWMPFTGLVDEDTSPWFRQYHDVLRQNEKRLRRKLFTWKQTLFYYAHKRLHGTYKGADIGTLRGSTSFFTVTDEIDYMDENMDSSRIKNNAYGTRTLLVKAGANVRAKAHTARRHGDNDPLDAYDSTISSPVSIRSPIMTLLRESDSDRAKYGFHYATFDLNPDITVESLENERLADPVEYDRQYRAIPPFGHKPFIDSEPMVRKACRGGPQRLMRWERRSFTDQLGYVSAFLEAICAEDRTRPRLMAVDTGHQLNAFALSVHSYDPTSQSVIVEGVLELEPSKDEPVNFPHMYDRCLAVIARSLNIKVALFDRWQHLDHMTRLRQEHGVDAQPCQLRKDHFDLFKAKLYSGNVILPDTEIDIQRVRSSKEDPDRLLARNPVASAAVQILTVRAVGHTVTKPSKGNDDIFRTLVLGVQHIFDEKNTPLFSQHGGGSAAKGSAQKQKARSIYLSSRGAPPQSVKLDSGRVAVVRMRRNFR